MAVLLIVCMNAVAEVGAFPTELTSGPGQRIVVWAQQHKDRQTDTKMNLDEWPEAARVLLAWLVNGLGFSSDCCPWSFPSAISTHESWRAGPAPCAVVALETVLNPPRTRGYRTTCSCMAEGMRGWGDTNGQMDTDSA